MPSAPHGLDTLRTYGTGFAGRQAELAELDRAWSEGVRIFVLHAQGGAGRAPNPPPAREGASPSPTSRRELATGEGARG